MGNAASLLDFDSGMKDDLGLKDDVLEILSGTVDVLNTIASLIDPYTANHQHRVSQLATAIAEKLDLPKRQIEGIKVGSLLHDIGKVVIPNDILSKYGAISEQEFGIIKCHPQNGYKILSKVKFPWPVHKMVLHHHERLDGWKPLAHTDRTAVPLEWIRLFTRLVKAAVHYMTKI